MYFFARNSRLTYINCFWAVKRNVHMLLKRWMCTRIPNIARLSWTYARVVSWRILCSIPCLGWMSPTPSIVKPSPLGFHLQQPRTRTAQLLLTVLKQQRQSRRKMPSAKAAATKRFCLTFHHTTYAHHQRLGPWRISPSFQNCCKSREQLCRFKEPGSFSITLFKASTIFTNSTFVIIIFHSTIFS